jgi:hypothetical protein
MSNEPRILIYDIETAPDIGYTWSKWNTNILDFSSDWYMLSFAWKWLGEKETYVLALPDYAGYKKNMHNDYELVSDLWKLFDQADITVSHNGKRFDKGKSHARMIFHGFLPPAPHKEIDTLEVARKEFRFTSNSLKDIAKYLKLPNLKMDPGNFSTWLGCMTGDMKCWAIMKKYNKQDVIVEEQLYLRMLPWINGHPNIALLADKPDACPKCGAEGKDNMISNGYRYYAVTRRRQYQCKTCGGYSLSRTLEKSPIKHVAS